MAKQLYFRGEGVQPHLNGIPTPNATHVPAVPNQAAEIVGDIAQLAGAATKAYLHAQSVKQAGLVDEAYLKARGQMLTWQNEYNRTHKAGDALDAQRDYEAQWNAIAQGIRQEYGGRLGDMYMGKLNHSMELGRLYALSHGGAYQEKETTVWNKNQTDLLGMNVLNAVDTGDMMQVQMERQRLADHLGRMYPGQDISPYMQKIDAGIFERRFEGMLARGEVEQADALLQGLQGHGGSGTQTSTQTALGGTRREPLAGVPSQTGVGTLLAKYESGTHGSSHVSYGLPHTDGVDVGKYSFITKGKGGGSVGEFVRWMGKNGGEVGEKLYAEMNAAVGGNWANLDNKAFWKSKGEKIWRDAIHSNPLAFEQGEDAFMKQYRFDPVMKQLRPEVRDAIQKDQTGALMEVAMSTINQHGQAVKILNGAYQDGMSEEDYIKAIYQERGNPARFAKTGDPNMGRRRFAKEMPDALAMLHGGRTANSSAAAGSQETSNQAGVRQAMYVAYDNPAGLVEQGNIDIANRPRVKNADGSVSTVRSMSVNIDGKETLIPTVSSDGRIMSDEEAIEEYKKTGKHLGKFDSVEHVTDYAKKLHEQQEKMYVGTEGKGNALPQQRQLPPGVDPAKVMAWQQRIDSARHKAAIQAGLTQESFQNHITFGYENGDFSYAQKDLEQLQRLGLRKEASEFSKDLDIAQKTYGITQSLSMVPFAERGKIAAEFFNRMMGPQNAKDLVRHRDHLLKSVQAGTSNFIKDPAGEVEKLGLIQPAAREEDKISASLKLQEEMGKGLNFRPAVIPKQIAEGLRNQYDSFKTGDQRVDFFIGLQTKYGKYTGDVLQQMKMSPGVSLMLPLFITGGVARKDLGVFLTGMTAKRGDDVKTDVNFDPQAMKDTVGNDFQLYNFAKQMSESMPNIDAFKQLRNDLLRAGYYYMKSTGKDGLGDIDDSFTTSTDYSTAIVLPKENRFRMSADDIADTVAYYRENGYLEKELIRQGALSENGGNRTRLLRRENILKNAIFIVNSDGDSFYLMDPATEKPISGKDGNLVSIGIRSVISKFGMSEETHEDEEW